MTGNSQTLTRRHGQRHRHRYRHSHSHRYRHTGVRDITATVRGVQRCVHRLAPLGAAGAAAAGGAGECHPYRSIVRCTVARALKLFDRNMSSSSSSMAATTSIPATGSTTTMVSGLCFACFLSQKISSLDPAGMQDVTHPGVRFSRSCMLQQSSLALL